MGLHVNSCQDPHTLPHQHTAWYRTTEEALKKAGNVPEFPRTGEMTLAYFAHACQFTTYRHGVAFLSGSQVPQPEAEAAITSAVGVNHLRPYR